MDRGTIYEMAGENGCFEFPELDYALVGLVELPCRGSILCYDEDKVVRRLAQQNDWPEDEARQYFYENVIGSYHGPMAPCFISLVEDDKK